MSSDRFEEALASYDRAIALRPDYAEALTNRGVTLHDLKRFDEALASYARAIACAPDYAEAHYHEAMCRLLIGDFQARLGKAGMAMGIRADWNTRSGISRSRYGLGRAISRGRPFFSMPNKGLAIPSSSAATFRLWRSAARV